MTSIPPGSGPILSDYSYAGDPPTFFMDAIAQRNRDRAVGYSSLDPRTFGMTAVPSRSDLLSALELVRMQQERGGAVDQELVDQATRDNEAVLAYAREQVRSGPPLTNRERAELIELTEQYAGQPREQLAAFQEFFETRGGLGRSAGLGIPD